MNIVDQILSMRANVRRHVVKDQANVGKIVSKLTQVPNIFDKVDCSSYGFGEI